MRRTMKGMKFIDLGVAIWGLSLLWPEVNLVLTPPVMIGLVLGLGAAAPLAYVLGQHLDHPHDRNSDGTKHVHPPQPIPASSDSSI